MLSLLTCSVSRLDDFDPPFAVPTPVQLQRRVSKSLGFIKTTSSAPKKRRVSKTTIGKPTGFRHELHLGKEVVPENMVTVWDTARWEQELKKDLRSSLPSSIAPSTVPSSPTSLNRSKRNSITPQKRKPVPSLIPDMPPIPPTAKVAPHAIPLPPSPTESVSERQTSECEPFEMFDSPADSRRRSSSIEGGQSVSKSKRMENESRCEITPTSKADVDDH